ncbi:MAG: hypothetical protein Q8P63_03020 [Candidatus Nealsonbacteria bacterium]|nr:hypothetical protein [Candidatus Nealsonbacteria bacterium]
MDFKFLKTQKGQRYIILFSALTIGVILFVIWQNILKPKPFQEEQGIIRPQIKINLGVLQDPKLAELKIFETISPLEGEIGRSNPFTPY